jgi:RNA polymerase II subunit A small phosphatase-like protein
LHAEARRRQAGPLGCVLIPVHHGQVVKPLLVILDLDETLVHACETPLSVPASFSIGKYLVHKRPHLDGFLASLRGAYRVAIWTASGRAYAEQVVCTIAPWHAELAFFWSAERCTDHFDHETRSHSTIKKLRKVAALGFDLERVVVIDDSPEKHVRNYGNLIPITPFEGDMSDAELPALLAYLHWLDSQPNVRAIDKRAWRT